MPQLTGGARPVDLGSGYFLRAPGVRGQAELTRPRALDERSRSRTVDDGTEALDLAFSAADMTEVRRVEISVQPQRPGAPPPGGAPPPTLRTGDKLQDALELIVPDLGPDTGQLVLACDEAGVLTWHLPIDDAGKVETPATRGSGGTKRFLIPATFIARPPEADPHTRSLLGVIGRKLLKILVYPITDPVFGAVSKYFARRWETDRRPYGLRDFNPGNFRQPLSAPLNGGDWARLAEGPALLFVHGTFSTAHSAFAQIPDEVIRELYRRYEGRVFAFNHFTLSEDPAENVRWLDKELGGQALDIDIVCHSRGGLVARTLAERPASLGLSVSNVRVERIVFVGVPNAGTVLADPRHMVAMLDRLTTALNLFPSGPVAEVLEAILTVIKVIGHGALKALSGLAAMQPDGAFLKKLNSGSPAGGQYFAIGADYEPVEDGLKALVAGTVANAVLDRVFQGTPNDLVVPEPGVFEAGAIFVPVLNRLNVPPEAGVIHTTLFGYPDAGAHLLDWLSGKR